MKSSTLYQPEVLRILYTYQMTRDFISQFIITVHAFTLPINDSMI